MVITAPAVILFFTACDLRLPFNLSELKLTFLLLTPSMHNIYNYRKAGGVFHIQEAIISH